MKKFKKWGKRNWLNSVTSEDSGSIEVSVNADAWSMYGELVLRDYDKQISISLYASDAKQFNKQIRKIDMILDHVLDLRDQMHVAYDYFKVAKVEEAERIKKRGKQDQLTKLME